MTKTISLVIAAMCLLGSMATTSHAADTPNVIFILADDLGYGDLSCYGQTKFQTPHIDRLASEGLKFTAHYSGNTVCSPSRANIMTGQHPGHVYIPAPSASGAWVTPTRPAPAAR
ncbi:MAG: sulfatase-like hydrolase/transferase [Planctomycetota bacterium]|jgi:arylsulfatase A-like enzyme